MRHTNKRRGREHGFNHRMRFRSDDSASRHLADTRRRILLERARIASDLHDDLGQALTVLKMGLEGVTAAIRRSEPVDSVIGRLQSLTREVQGAIAGVRVVILDLRPTVLENLGLPAAIELQALAFQSRTGIPCETGGLQDASGLRGSKAKAAFRFIEEALNNVSTHAGAHQVHLEVTRRDGCISIKVTDDGCGIDSARVVGRTTLGLTGMRERASRLGGQLAIAATLPHGTALRLDLPL